MKKTKPEEAVFRTALVTFGLESCTTSNHKGRTVRAQSCPQGIRGEESVIRTGVSAQILRVSPVVLIPPAVVLITSAVFDR
jgi:hypothetical protein